MEDPTEEAGVAGQGSDEAAAAEAGSDEGAAPEGGAQAGEEVSEASEPFEPEPGDLVSLSFLVNGPARRDVQATVTDVGDDGTISVVADVQGLGEVRMDGVAPADATAPDRLPCYGPPETATDEGDEEEEPAE